jgi:hypothetical protein
LFTIAAVLVFMPIQRASAEVPPAVLNSTAVKEFIRVCNQRNITQGCNCSCNTPSFNSSTVIFNRCAEGQRSLSQSDCSQPRDLSLVDRISVDASSGNVIRLELAGSLVDGQANTGGPIPLQPSGGLLAYTPEGELDFAKTIPRIITLILILAAFVAGFTVVQGGFTYVNSQGNDEEVKKGSQTMLMAVLGLIIILLSIAVVEVATGALGLNITPIDAIIDDTPAGIDGDKEFFNPTTNP